MVPNPLLTAIGLSIAIFGGILLGVWFEKTKPPGKMSWKLYLYPVGALVLVVAATVIALQLL